MKPLRLVSLVFALVFLVSGVALADPCPDGGSGAFCYPGGTSGDTNTYTGFDPSAAVQPGDPGAVASYGSQGFVPLENIGGLYGTNPSQPRQLSEVLNTIFKFGLGIAALLAVLMITWGGFQYMLAGTPFAKEDGREWITSAIYGLLIILLSYILLVTINPQIVNNNSLLGGTTSVTSPATRSTPPPGSNVVQNSSGLNLVAPKDTTNQQVLFSSPGETLCTWGSDADTGTVLYSSFNECQSSCPTFGSASGTPPRCSAVGF